MAKQIAGSVRWIENGKQTSKLVDVAEAFNDPAQARDQVLFAEASGDREQTRLVRLAYRQFQGMRYRGESKAKPKGTAESVQPSTKPSRKKPLRAKSSKKPVARGAAAKKPGVRKPLAKRANKN